MRLVRQVVKALVHRPWYAASIIVVMSVGCALLTSVLAIVDGVLFKPLGYPGERELVAIKLSSNQSRYAPGADSGDLAAWTQAAPQAVFTGFRQHSRTAADIQPNFFDVIGVRPALGGFAPEDFEGAAPTIAPRIIMDEVFRSQFGGDPAAIGRVVIVDPSTGSGYRIAGVMPPGFMFPLERWAVDYLTPFVESRYGPYTIARVIARIPPGAATDELAARVFAVAIARNAARGPAANTSNNPIDRVEVEPLKRALGAASRPLFTALLLAAGLLVAIAALNTSSLMAARSVDRARELAVRRALGATSIDIGRLLLVEAALLVGSGTLLGLMIAAPLLRFISGLLPEGLALFRTAAIDWRVAAFSAAITVALAILVTAWPLRLAIAGDASPGHERSVTGPARSFSWRLVVTAQVAIALVLTVGGSLLIGSLLTVYAQTPAITTKNILTIAVEFLGMPGAVGSLAPERRTRVDALLGRLRAVPGVDAASLTAYNLLEHAYEPSRFKPPGPARNSRQAMVTQAVTADFYRIVQPQLTAGRWPTALESANDVPVIVVSELVASTYWPNAPAIGQTLTDQTMSFTVVGVVKEVRWAAWDERPTPTIYAPYVLVARQRHAAVLLNTSAPNARVIADALRVMGETDSLLRVGRVMPLDDLFVDSVRPRRFQAWLFGSFAFASLFVVGLGIFGQLAMSTARRTREVGIRMACGATRGSIARLILGEQLVPVVVGLVTGGLVAAWAVQFVKSYLYQIESSDPRVWIAAIALILLTAAVGTIIPALRASRTDPIQSLRGE